MMKFIPTPLDLAPSLRVRLVDGSTFDLAEEPSDRDILVAFYRGVHSTACRQYLVALDAKAKAFAVRGVSIVAISTDDDTRAVLARRDWMLTGLRIGFGLRLSQARDWGLYVSKCETFAVGQLEPPLYSEPGLFLVGRDRRIVFGSVQSMPFGRPTVSEVLDAIEPDTGARSNTYGCFTEDVQ